MQARGDSHADDSHAAAATTRIGLSCAVTRSCAGRRSLRGRILCGRVIDTRRGHVHRLSDGRGKQADRLRRGWALGEDGTREELEGRSEGTGSVYMLRGCGPYPNSKDSRIRIGSSRSVASGTVRGSSLRGCCRRGGLRSGVVRCPRALWGCSSRSRFSGGAVRCSRGGGRRVRCLGRRRHGLLNRLGDRLCCGVTVPLSLSLSSFQCSQERQQSSRSCSFSFPAPCFYAIAVNPSNLMGETARL